MQNRVHRCKRLAGPVRDTGVVTATTHLRVLGELAVERADEPCPIGGPKAQRLLCVLTAHRGRAVSSDRLVDGLWGEDPPRSAIATLQSQVSRLRALLGPSFGIERTAGGYRLDVRRGEIDADRFEAQLRRSAALDTEAKVVLLDASLAGWRGPAFAGHADVDEVRSEAMRLDELRLVATDAWAEAQLAIGDPAEMIGQLEALVRAQPLREHYWRLLMLALYRTGRQAEALRRGGDLREELRRTAGLDPSPVLRELEGKILADDPSLRPETTGARQRVPARSPRVPQLLGATSFVGRAPEVAATAAAVDEHPLVTITGPGGVGKTRLALRTAARFVDRLDDGVTVVELAPLHDPGGVAQVIANSLDIQQRQYRTIESTIEEHLAGSDRLLVLDNCEHLIDTIAPLIDRLRAGCPRLTVLATSREPLGLAGEYVTLLAPLKLPTETTIDPTDLQASAAVELFVARASAATPGFELTQANAVAVATICQRLEGLPLALELAAARLRSMGVDALADRLQERLGLMDQTQRGADGRHRTLHDLVDWSHALLHPHEQEMFELLSVFAGGFDLPAVGSVCDTPRSSRAVDTLAGLVDKSMVVLVDPTLRRYRMLEPLREFGRDRLEAKGLLEVTEDRHLGWFLDLAERGGAGIDSRDEAAWSRALDLDADNFRAAHLTAIRRGDVDSALRIVASLREHAFRRIGYEIVAWADETMAMAGATDHALGATVRAVSAYGRFVTGDMEAAIELALRALGDETTGAGAPDADSCSDSGLPERVLGNARFYLDRPSEALESMDRMSEAARRSGDRAQIAHALYMRSVAETSIGNTVRGAVLAGEVKAAAEAAGSLTAHAQADYALGLAIEATDPPTALRHLERASRSGAEAGNRWIEAFSLTEVHWLQARHGEQTAALDGFAGVVDTWYRGGDWANQWLSLRRVLATFIDLGAFQSAATLHGALSAVGASHALPFEPDDADRLVDSLDQLRSILGPAAYADAVRRGASMPDREIVDFAREQIAQLTAEAKRT